MKDAVRAALPTALPTALLNGDAFVFATAQYDSGDWDSAPMVPANVIDAIARYTALPVAPQGRASSAPAARHSSAFCEA